MDLHFSFERKMSNSTFSLACPSNSSLEYFPNNHASKFSVHFPDEILLPGDGWQVSLYSITYPNSWINWTVEDSKKYFCYADITGTINTSLEDATTKVQEVKVHLPPGNYSSRRQVYNALSLALLKARYGLLLTGPSYGMQLPSPSGEIMLSPVRDPRLNVGVSNPGPTSNMRWHEMHDIDTFNLFLPPGKTFRMHRTLATLLGLIPTMHPSEKVPVNQWNQWLKQDNGEWIFDSNNGFYPNWSIHDPNTKYNNETDTPVFEGFIQSNITPIQSNQTNKLNLVPYRWGDGNGNYDWLHFDGKGENAQFCLGANLSRQRFSRHMDRLMIYSDIVESQIVGQQQTDLLKEVVVSANDKDPAYFAPADKLWVPVRKKSIF